MNIIITVLFVLFAAFLLYMGVTKQSRSAAFATLKAKAVSSFNAFKELL